MVTRREDLEIQPWPRPEHPSERWEPEMTWYTCAECGTEYTLIHSLEEGSEDEDPEDDVTYHVAADVDTLSYCRVCEERTNEDS